MAGSPRGWTIERYIAVAKVNAHLAPGQRIPMPGDEERAAAARLAAFGHLAGG